MRFLQGRRLFYLILFLAFVLQILSVLHRG